MFSLLIYLLRGRCDFKTEIVDRLNKIMIVLRDAYGNVTRKVIEPQNNLPARNLN